MSRPKNSNVDMWATFDGVDGKPCSNAKFMHIAGLPGMTIKDSYDCHYHEETKSVYRGDVLMAERVMSCVHFPGERPTVNCFIVNYYKGIEDE